jgi:WD40 repeat protein
MCTFLENESFRSYAGAFANIVLRTHLITIQNVTLFSFLFTCSTDKTIRVWDMETGACVRKFRGHKDIVNSVHPARRGPQLVCTGSDDGTIMVWIDII